MPDHGVLPNGPEWRCSKCGRSYPETYEPASCECGHGLTRVLASFKSAMAFEVDGGNAMLDAEQDDRPAIVQAARDRGRGLRDG